MRARNLLTERRDRHGEAAAATIATTARQEPGRPILGVRVITIDKVIRGECHSAAVRSWRREAIAWLPNHELAAEAAMAWFDETDQSAECELAMLVQDHVPNSEIVRVIVGPQIVAKVMSRTLLGGGVA